MVITCWLYILALTKTKTLHITKSPLWLPSKIPFHFQMEIASRSVNICVYMLLENTCYFVYRPVLLTFKTTQMCEVEHVSI